MSEDIRNLINNPEALAKEKKDDLFKSVGNGLQLKDSLQGTKVFDRGLFVIKTIDTKNVSATNYLEGTIVRDETSKNLYVCEIKDSSKSWVKKTSEVLPDSGTDNTFLNWTTENGFKWIKAVNLHEIISETLPATEENGSILLLSSTETGQQVPYICIRIV